MKRFFLIFLFLTSLFSDGIHWIKDYKKAFEIAKKEHKLLMVDISVHHCPPCWYMANIVYKYKPVIDYVNRNFVPIFIYADTDKVPIEFSIYFTGEAPNVLLITPDDKLYYRIFGSRPAKVFLQILKQYNEKYQKGI
ncbi:conserved hypothetical protein [Lebetimonas natsushimae]|uniref:Spermatogenesis-associated protein 20-like TRX domain-containing protein n=1 Tax=Lebetimonas natsushimae TaxID=1936991 RepID=A0A292YE95_9BACT|nr:DUF255 domain-containing protein [Lebetimonas natsushimae]GAX87908.1 conserved hypothetical protein [Lebetimonas natsushimae]